jgi:hypothetical protein
MAVEVHSKSELKAAMSKGVDEIVVLDTSLAKQLEAVQYIKSLGPVAVGAVIAAIPLIVFTGGLGAAGLGLAGALAGAGAAPGAAWATSAIVGLIVAVGGTIAISLFTDWDYVELPMGIKLRRKGKGAK